RSNVKESDVRSNAKAIDLVSSASQGNRRYSRLPAARRSKRTVSAYPECIQVSTWLLCKVTSGYGAGTKKNVYKSVRGYGAGYGAGLIRMYIVSTWLRCRLRCRDLKNVYK